MEGMFPLGTGVSRVRAIIGMLKQRGGSMSMSELAEESEEDIDDLLPLIDACKLLGLATIRKSTLQLTDKGRKLRRDSRTGSRRAGSRQRLLRCRACG